MKVIDIINLGYDHKTTLGMILSGNVDFGNENGGMISVNKFDSVIKDILVWFCAQKNIEPKTNTQHTHEVIENCAKEIYEWNTNTKSKNKYGVIYQPESVMPVL